MTRQRLAWLVLVSVAPPACVAAGPTRAPAASNASAPVASCVTTQGPPLPVPNPIGRVARIPAATYKMGSEHGDPDERPVHEVHVAAFEMDLTEVTVADYAACVQAKACQPASTRVQFPAVTMDDQQLFDSECNDDRADRQDHPANCVDWTMADGYCRWAGKRLPTEEEWEYAACGGNCEAAGVRTGAVVPLGDRWPFTQRVAARWPGPFGLYDMAGNVWEWTASPYCPYDHPGCADPRRVIRGGSWALVDYVFVRMTDRSPADPTNRVTSVGFRCARTVAQAGAS